MTIVSPRSLRGRILFVTGSFFVVSSLLLATFHFLQSRAALLAELEKRGFSLTENVVFRTRRALEVGRLEEFRAEMARSCGNGDVEYLIVQDPDGQVLAEAATPETDLASIRPVLVASTWKPDTLEILPFKDSRGRLLNNFSAPVWYEARVPDGAGVASAPRRMATVRIGYATNPTLKRIETALSMSLGLWLALSGAGLILIFLVTRWALHPLAGMADTARSISRGDLTRRVTVATEDEVGALGTAFNEMMESLAASRVALARRTADLEDAVREKERSYQELKQTQDRLAHSESTRRAEKLRSVGQMANGVAHDFNNTLSVITGRVQLLRMKGDQGRLAPQDVMNSLEIIERASLDGAETVRRIQEFSRDRGGQEMQRADLNHMVREVVETTRPRWKDQAEQDGIRIDVKMNLQRLSPVACVPSEIREVLTNLVFNAVDAMPVGGTIQVRTEATPEGALLVLSDSGTGMPAEVRERIFEPYYTTKGARGNGLGLSIVYGIIQRHGGDITVTSEAGVGTQFHMHLLAAGADTRVAGKDVMMRNRPSRILIADDEFNVREALAALLIALGHEVVEAFNGRDALEKFAAGGFDMVFTDLGMPDMSGWEVVEAIRRDDAGIPVVLVTGWGNQLTGDEADARGVTRILAKPFTIQKVSSLIAEVQGFCQSAA